MKFLIASIVLIGNVAFAQTVDFGPSDMGTSFNNMEKAQTSAVMTSKAVKSYATQNNMGAIIDVEYVYSSFFGKAKFVVSTANGCQFEAAVKLANWGWKASSVAGSESCN